MLQLKDDIFPASYSSHEAPCMLSALHNMHVIETTSVMYRTEAEFSLEEIAIGGKQLCYEYIYVSCVYSTGTGTMLFLLELSVLTLSI